jgi:hypothetical protein
MIMRASALGMGVNRFSRQMRGGGVLAMPDRELHTTQLVESDCEDPLGAGIHGAAVEVFIDRHYVVNRV